MGGSDHVNWCDECGTYLAHAPNCKIGIRLDKWMQASKERRRERLADGGKTIESK